MQDKEFLGTAPVGRLLAKLALPTLTAQLVNMLYNVVDRIYIGHIEDGGDLALTGLGVCMPIIMIVSAFAALVGSGGAPMASIFMGKRDIQSAEKILGASFVLQLVLSAVISVALAIWQKPLLLAFGASENTIGYALEYMSVYALGTVFVQLTLGMNAFITAQGATATAMISVVIGAVLNIALDPLFIYGFDMGVRGAAVATVISQALSCAWVMAFLFGKRSVLRLKRENMRLSARVLLPCLALGSATFIMQASESVISVCFNASLLKYGGDVAVGSMTILAAVMQFAMLPMQGIAQGAQPILSYNYGAKNADRVKRTFWILLFTCLTYSLTLFACVMAFPRGFASAFTPHAHLVEFSAKMMRIYFGGMAIFGIQVACQMTFVSLGEAASSVTVAVVRKFVLLLPLIYIMPNFVSDKTLGVYMAEPVADIIAVTFTTVLFFFKFRRRLRMLQQQ